MMFEILSLIDFKELKKYPLKFLLVIQITLI